MITDRRLAQMRLAAALVHQHHGLVVEVLDEGRPIVQVSSVPGEVPPPVRAPGSVLTIAPCGFRGAVASAWASHRAGRRVQLLDLAAEPEVALAVADGGGLLPGGIAFLRDGEAPAYVFGTFLHPERCREESRRILAAEPAPEGVVEMVLRRDCDLEVTVVAAVVDPDGPVDEPAVVALLEQLLARFVAAELIDSLAATPSRP